MSYVGVQPVIKASRVLTEGTLSQNTNIINVAGGYKVGNIAVYLAGVKLQTSEYTATDGVNIDLVDTFDAGTDYIVEEYRSFSYSTLDPSLFANQTQAETASNDLVIMNPSATAEAINAIPRKNAIINGNFDVWQRGISLSLSAVTTYLADRWVTVSNVVTLGGGTQTISRQSFALGQAGVPNEPEFFWRSDQSVASSGATFNVLKQLIEDVRTFAGQTVTLSFYARSDSNLKITTIDLRQDFGTGGSPSTPVATVLASSVALGTNDWNKYTYTVTLPSISGKTIGTNGDDHLQIEFFLEFDTTGTHDIAQVQLEKGSAATNFEYRPIGGELDLCNRYYQILEAYQLKGYAANTLVSRFVGNYFKIMRDTPTVSLLSETTILAPSGSQTSSGASIGSNVVGNKGVRIDISGFTGLTAGEVVIGANNTGILALDAEL